MKFITDKNNLKNALNNLANILEKKGTIPVLSMIAIESISDNSLRITATDLDLTLTTVIEAEILDAGKICTQGRKLTDIVRMLAENKVTFESEANDWMKVSNGKSKFRIAGANFDTFPETPEFKLNQNLFIQASKMNYLIDQTAYAITLEQSRFTLSGAKFETGKKAIKMVATDGHRLGFSEIKSDITEVVDVIIPKKALGELNKLTKEFPAELVYFNVDNNHISFQISNYTLFCRKLSGAFPNYEMIIPKTTEKIAEIDADVIKTAIKRVALMSDERTRSIVLNLRKNEIEFFTQSSEEGEANEIIPAEYSNEDCQISFNFTYLLDAISHLMFLKDENEEATPKNVKQKLFIKINDGNSPVLFQNSNGDSTANTFGIVMPTRV